MWILVVFASLLVVSFLFFLGMYLYFARKDPDSLRSETYALQRQLIDKGLVGDAGIGGLIDISGDSGSSGIRKETIKSIENGTVIGNGTQAKETE